MTTKCGIYKITNNINGKIYIGQSKGISRRWWTHGSGKKPNCPKFHNAIKKYGKKNFSVSILEEVEPNDEILIAREQHYLDTLQPFDSRGYNISKTATTGLSQLGIPKKGNLGKGKNNVRNKPVCQYDKTGTIIATFYSIQQASDALSINRMSITNNIKCRSKTAGGFCWAFEGELPNIRPRISKKGWKYKKKR